MLNCFQLDFLTAKSTLRTYLLMFCIALGLSVAIKSSFGIIYMFMLALIVSCAPFSAESNTRISKFRNGLPIKRSDQVKGRYLFLVSMMLVTWVIASIIVYVRYSAGSFEYANVISCFLAGVTVAIISMIQYPLYYKFGLIKGRMLNMVIYILPIVIVLLLPVYAQDTIMQLIEPKNFGIVSLVLLGGVLITLLISYTISKTILKNKEL